MTTSGRIENPGITVAPCRLPSPKTTAPWARRPQTSWPSTTPGAPPGPCSRRRQKTLPPFWGDIAELGWLGLHLPEELGGSGFGLPELVVVVEELGRAVTPGPFVPTVIASAVIDSVGGDELKRRLLPGLADGSVLAGVGLTSDISVSGGKAAGSAPAVLGGGLAQILVLPAGDDAIVVDVAAGGVTVETPLNLDPTRRSARVTLDGAPAEVLPGGRRALVDLARLIVAAEAVGVATECTEQAAAYAKVRLQFGRPIAMFEAVKHHCANMLVASELATANVWDAARAAEEGGDQLTYTAAMAAALALPAADECAQLNIQVHGGIGFTWEHDAHLYLRRATALEAVVDAEAAALDVDRCRTGRGHAGTHDRPAARGRAHARRGARLRRARQGPGRRGAARGDDRDGLRHAALAQAVGAQRRRGRAAGDRAGVPGGGGGTPAVRHHGVGDPDADPARHRGPGGPLGAAGAAPRGHLVPALQRARRRERRGRDQDAGYQGGRRLAGQRAEGVDERRPPGQLRPGHHPHRPRRSQARRHHHDGDRHARRGRRGPAPQDGDGPLGVQRGLLQRRLHPRRRRGGAGQRRLDGGPGHPRQRVGVHRQRRRRRAWRRR